MRTVVVKGCARCGNDHEIEFTRFAQNAIEADDEVLTHWGMCSDLNEPVLMRIVETEEVKCKTDEELLALRELCGKAKPFPTDGPGMVWEEMTEAEKDKASYQIGYNNDFFISTHAVLPELIDEVLHHRQVAAIIVAER